MTIVCIQCNSTASYKNKWFNGPICRSCYRKNLRNKNSGLARLGPICIQCETITTSQWYKGPMCNSCYHKDHHEKNKENHNRLNRERSRQNPKSKKTRKKPLTVEERRAKERLKYELNSAIVLFKKAMYRQKKKELTGQDITKDANKKWKDNNPDWEANKCNDDANYHLSKVIRSRINNAILRSGKSIKRRPASTIKTLGCSIDKARKHIESLWEPWMNWENHGRGPDKWHIDHIEPLAKFDLTDPKQFKKACHYTNLRPLSEFKNLSDGARGYRNKNKKQHK